MPLDLGRVTHLLDQMHRSEDDSGDPIDDGFLLAADGARGQRWVDPTSLSSTLTIKDEGSTLTTAASSIDFVGAGVTASGTTGAKTVTVSGAPTGAAGGDLSGTYPNPSVVDDSHNHTSATLPAAGRWELAVIAGSPPDPLYADGDYLYILV